MSKYLLYLVFFVGGCFEAPRKMTFEDSDSFSASSGGDSSDVQGDTEDSSSPSNKATLFTTDLHSARFQVAAPQVQPLDCPGDIKIPVLSYMLPAESEYLEILRCPASLSLTGTLGRSLQEVLSMPTTELQVEMQTSHFFQQALGSEQCVMVHHAFKQHLIFTDYTARKGVYYLIRACVSPERIRDREVAGIEFCSRWVARSPVWEHENPATREDLKRLENAQSKQIAMEKSYYTLYNLASGIFDALNACDVKEEERQIADRKKKAINMLISLGVGAGMGFATGKNPLKTADALSGSLSAVLNDLTTKPEDFPRSCYEATQKYRIFRVQVKLYFDYSRAYQTALESKPSTSC